MAGEVDLGGVFDDEHAAGGVLGGLADGVDEGGEFHSVVGEEARGGDDAGAVGGKALDGRGLVGGDAPQQQIPLLSRRASPRRN